MPGCHLCIHLRYAAIHLPCHSRLYIPAVDSISISWRNITEQWQVREFVPTTPKLLE